MRLIQSVNDSRSLALYARLGFEVRQPLVCLQGPALGGAIDGHTIRTASPTDLESRIPEVELAASAHPAE